MQIKAGGPVDTSGDNSLMEVYKFLRATLAGKMLELYLRSKNSAFKHKKESYLIFKSNLDQFLTDELGVLSLLLQTFVSITVRCEPHLPKMDRLARIRGIKAQGNLDSIPENQVYK